MPKKKSAGQTVDSYCGKCKLERAHTVMVTGEETTDRVRCNTCGSVHKSRSAPEEGKRRNPRPKDAAVDGAKALAVWEARLAEATGKELPYSMAGRYRVGDIVDHFMFGRGVVLKLHSKRCEMLFRDKSRLMVSANQ